MNVARFLKKLVGDNTRFDLEIRGDPKIIVYGKLSHYSFDTLENDLLSGLDLGVILHEDLCDSIYFGEEDRFDHGQIYNQGSQNKKEDIVDRVYAVSLAKKKKIDVVGLDAIDRKLFTGFWLFLFRMKDGVLFWRSKDDRKEVNFVRILKRHLHMKKTIVLVVGMFHARSASYVSDFLRKSNLSYAVIRLKEGDSE